MADFALLFQLHDWLKRLFDRDFRIDAVQLPQIDHVGLKQAEAFFYFLREVIGSPVGTPEVRALAGQSAFGCYDQALRKR